MERWCEELGYAATLVAAVAVGLMAQAVIGLVYWHYSRVASSFAAPSSFVAGEILRSQGLGDVDIVKASADSENRYDLRARKVILAARIYAGKSVRSVAAAAHECGHAMQHRDMPYVLAAAEVMESVASVCSTLWLFIFAVGVLLGVHVVMHVGVFVLGIALVCQVLCFGVELDASRRAIGILRSLAEERLDASLAHAEFARLWAVLLAGALTYVFAVAVNGPIELARAAWRAFSQ